MKPFGEDEWAIGPFCCPVWRRAIRGFADRPHRIPCIPNDHKEAFLLKTLSIFFGLVRTAIAIAVIAAVGYLLWLSAQTQPLLVQGEVSAARIDLSPRVAGRVIKLNAAVGDTVEKDTVIAELESPQLEAALTTAEAALDVAKADFSRVNSTRPETIAARRADVAAAQADVVLTQAIYDRVSQLLSSGNAPQSTLDEARRNQEAAMRKREAAEATLQLTIAGASAEERALSAAQVKAAEATVKLRRTDVAELTLRTPIRAEVTTRVAELGENFAAGSTLYSLVDMSDLWFTFNIREDLLHGLKIGDTFDVRVPALGLDKVELKVTMINVQGQYSTWRATRATGDFDLRTFEVRAVPTGEVKGLRPGMSAITAWADRAR
jgi:HlyD family secretion protein